jgi:hypothetical protein
MPRGRITKRAVDALQCPAAKDREFLWDDALSGFGVAAFPSGKKVYVAQYRQAGRSRRANLGEHGPLTPEEARTEAKKLLGDVARGLDPIEHRRAARAVPLFRDIASEFMRIHIASKRKPRTSQSYETLIRLYILPAIGSIPLTLRVSRGAGQRNSRNWRAFALPGKLKNNSTNFLDRFVGDSGGIVCILTVTSNRVTPNAKQFPCNSPRKTSADRARILRGLRPRAILGLQAHGRRKTSDRQSRGTPPNPG